ncbi:hypothetical protein D068_cds33690 [Bacillus atrophaeus UCMB-5137]|nr:hypothetical protein D068_cds33690 [Bacillus atrophaeus UCMB-5137]
MDISKRLIIFNIIHLSPSVSVPNSESIIQADVSFRMHKKSFLLKKAAFKTFDILFF